MPKALISSQVTRLPELRNLQVKSGWPEGWPEVKCSQNKRVSSPQNIRLLLYGYCDLNGQTRVDLKTWVATPIGSSQVRVTERASMTWPDLTWTDKSLSGAISEKLIKSRDWCVKLSQSTAKTSSYVMVMLAAEGLATSNICLTWKSLYLKC